MKTDTIKHSFSGRILKKATCIFGLCMLMLVGAAPISAQVYSTEQEPQHSYNAYQPTVYEPFGSSLPSESNPVYSNAQGTSDWNGTLSNRRNVGGVQGDPGDQSDESPVGEAWVMLLFGAVAAAVVFVRQRKAAVKG